MSPVSIICSTDEFWDVLGNPRTCRVTLHKAVIADQEYWCSNPPETIPGYIEAKVGRIINDLGYNKPRQSWFQRLLTKVGYL